MIAVLTVLINALAPFLVEWLKEYVDEWSDERARERAIEDMANVPSVDRDTASSKLRDGSF